MKCNYASSGCNYPEAECAGMCMGDFETHPRGTADLLAQLRAEREALTLQVEEQRRLLERVRVYMCEPAGLTVPTATNKELFMQFLNAIEDKTNALRDDITQHLKGKA